VVSYLVLSVVVFVYAIQGISPYAFAMLGVAASIAFSIVGAAWYVIFATHQRVGPCRTNSLCRLHCRGILLTGASLLGAAVKSPRIRSKNLIR
jgi:V-type H+-transporting ATPase proteolipid subunit